MSVPAIKGGLAAAYATVTPALIVLSYEPTSVQGATIYTLAERFERGEGPVTRMEHTFLSRLLVKYQDPAAAEALVDAYISSIPQAVAADPTLGGVIATAQGDKAGYARITVGETSFVTVGGVKCRNVDFTVTVLEKANRGQL